MRKKTGRKKADPEVVAILAADIHLSDKPPIARSLEPDWFAAMARPLDEIEDLAEETGAVVLYAGDIFDKYNPSPELINFAIPHLPEGYAIPGQHDLKFHSQKDIHKTAYWTLAQVGTINHLNYNYPVCSGLCSENGAELRIWGFGWNDGIFSIDKDNAIEDFLDIALVHKYVWQNRENNHAKVSESQHISRLAKKMRGFDIIVTGDNHCGFHALTKPQIWNCGSLMARHSDQRDYRPRVGLLYSTGEIGTHYLSTFQDKWLDEKELVKKVADMTNLPELVDEFKKLAGKSMDFLMELQRVMRDEGLGEDIKEVLIRAIQRAKEKK